MTPAEKQLLNMLLSDVMDGKELYLNIPEFRTAATRLAQGYSAINLIADLARNIREQNARLKACVGDDRSIPIFLKR